jgi:hypothetical protein
MSSRAWHTVSRRAALTGFAITAACGSVLAEQVSDSTRGENGAGPIFSPLGPNAELYGAAEGFPIADHSLAHQPGEPHQVKYRVGPILPMRFILNRVLLAFISESVSDCLVLLPGEQQADGAAHASPQTVRWRHA